MRWRYLVTFFLYIIAFFAIISKLFYWQVVKAAELAELGQQQYAKPIEIPAARGDIRTSDNFPLATGKISYLVFANPKEIKDKKETADKLAPPLQTDAATISALLEKDLFWVPLKQHIDNKEKESVEGLHVRGVGFQEQTTRLYPEASMAANLLGFIGKDTNGNDKGYFGLEGYYDRQLKGRPGHMIQIHDAFGRPVLSKLNDTSGTINGRTIILSLDRAIQFLVEKKLKEGIDTYGAESGMAAVMDPKTGNILAMANFPSFDPKNYQDYPESLYKNPFITDTYEPGSTFKPLVMAAALDAKLITPETECPICDGPVSIGGYTIHTWNDKYYNNTSMIDVMIHSDNTGMVYISQKMGLNRMLSYLASYGIGDATGIDLEGELAPGLKSQDDWYAIDVATAAFGQGISVTPIELLDAFSTIANNGERMQPHIVSKIITPDGQTISILPKVLSKPVSPASAKVMTEMLINAVNKGEAKWARLKGYRIAGKTGTASIPVHGHYDPTKTIASFIGYAPADNPKFIMLVILNKPTASIYGAETAAPIFFDIAKNILVYYGIAPSGGDEGTNN